MEARTAAYFLFVTAVTDRQSTTGCSQPVLRRFQVRPMHKWHSQTLAIRLMISASSLVYSCVTACSGSPHNVLHFLVDVLYLRSLVSCSQREYRGYQVPFQYQRFLIRVRTARCRLLTSNWFLLIPLAMVRPSLKGKITWPGPCMYPKFLHSSSQYTRDLVILQ